MGWSLHRRGKNWYVFHRFTSDGTQIGKSTGCNDKEDAYRAALEIVREARIALSLDHVKGRVLQGYLKDGAEAEAEAIYKQEEERLLGDRVDQVNPRLATLWTFGRSYRTDTGWIPDYLWEIGKSVMFIATFRSRWRNFTGFLPPDVHRVNQITKAHCEAYVAHKATKLKAYTLYTSHTPSVRKVFSILIEKGWYHSENPMEIFKRPLESLPIERVKVLSAEAIADIDAMFKEFGDPAFHLFFQLGVHTGMRRGEIANLLWENVHLDGKPEPYLLVKPNDESPERGVVRYSLKTRNSTRRIPLKGVLSEVLRPHSKPAGYVIDSSKYKCNRYFFRIPESLLAAIKKKHPYYSYHVMRHTFISQALMVGKVPPVEVAKWAGDNLQTILNTYSHFMPTGNINNW